MEPIIYTKSSCASSRKAKKWLKEHNISFTERNINKESITPNEIKAILTLTEGGVEEVISFKSKVYQHLQFDFETITFNEIVELIQENPGLLRLPIVKDEKRLQVGFNAESIRQFLPRETRRRALSLVKQFELGIEIF